MSPPSHLARHVWPIVVVLSLVWTGTLRAASSEGYRNCLLEQVKPAQSALAAQYLQQACARRFPEARPDKDLAIRPDAEDSLLAYDHCLFKQLAAVQNDQSAQWMEQFCHDQHHPGTIKAGGKPVPMLNLLNILVGAPTKQSTQDAPHIDGDGFVPLQPAQAGR
ncbi:hypothetical protein SIID45300_02988 [Candidatus Magnetaquicoccaceae bacterium FCR-1]|uniref:Secreted protein n=1 Tax=Candidatus Magnetaquiglobus chichijimensis TaxID=3141448 RepID=A0ABQ0CCM8_9PROT